MCSESVEVVSAPGKVLLTGAYLVLEQPHSALVLSTTSRFFAIVKSLQKQPQHFWSHASVDLVSPQLCQRRSYRVCLWSCKITEIKKQGFPEHAIRYAVAAALATADQRGQRQAVYHQLLRGLEITILGNNDFYSFHKQLQDKGLRLDRASFSSLPEFSKVIINETRESTTSMAPEVAKTGLGSSASMTTAIVAGILQHLGIVRLDSTSVGEEDLHLVHAVSQAAHCHAQGKVGSGFDVSAAVYGSQRYVRFSPAVLSPVLETTIDEKGKAMSLERAMKKVLETNAWLCQRSEFSLPPGFHMVLGDVGRGGSDTSKMVRAVKSPPDGLAKANVCVEKDLMELHESYCRHPESFMAAMEFCSTRSAKQWTEASENEHVVGLLQRTRDHFNSVRSSLRQMGEEVEPPLQTELADATMELPGVVFSGVPGAGGNDAIFAITIGKSAHDVVESLWSERGVLMLSVDEDPHGVQLEPHDPRQEVR